MASEMHKTSNVDWTKLHLDLLSLISKKLGEISNFINVRAVCKSWRSSIDASNPQKQLPWLLMTHIQQEETKFSVYSLFSGKIHTLQFPIPLSVFNYSLNLENSKRKLTANYGGRSVRFDAASRETKIIDEITGSIISIIPPMKNFIYFDYLIATPDGSVLGIPNPFHMKNWLPLKRIHFEVYRLENENNDPYWFKVSGIGDLMIFLNFDGCFCRSASDFDGFKGNFIYFWRDTANYKHSSLCEIGRYDFGENRTEVLARNDYVARAWFVPT